MYWWSIHFKAFLGCAQLLVWFVYISFGGAKQLLTKLYLTFWGMKEMQTASPFLTLFCYNWFTWRCQSCLSASRAPNSNFKVEFIFISACPMMLYLDVQTSIGVIVHTMTQMYNYPNNMYVCSCGGSKFNHSSVLFYDYFSGRVLCLTYLCADWHETWDPGSTYLGIILRNQNVGSSTIQM